MVVSEAQPEEFAEIARLVNSAYRGGDTGVGWTHEQGLVDGSRTSPEDLIDELSGPEPCVILCVREKERAPIRACVLLRKHPDSCYLGMLSVAPDAQARGLGRFVLERSEAWARQWGCRRVSMTVLHVRQSLIEWYGRRGYSPTGETIPFPYGNKALGVPRRDDLAFVVLQKTLEL